MTTDESKTEKIAEFKKRKAESRALKEEAKSLIKENQRLKLLRKRYKKKIEVLERAAERRKIQIAQLEGKLDQESNDQ